MRHAYRVRRKAQRLTDGDGWAGAVGSGDLSQGEARILLALEAKLSELDD